ncbi:MAG: tetratricopeptide repeat protein [Xanthobacteraceae bacterium]
MERRSDIERLLGLATELARHNNYAAALQAFDDFLSRNPAHVDALLQAGLAALSSHDPHRALGYYSAAALHAPQHPAVLLGYGQALRDLGQLDSARVKFEEMLRHYPSDADALTELGLVCRKLGDAAAALRHLDAATRSAPHLMWPRIHLAMTLRDEGQIEEALQTLAAALEQDVTNLYALREAAETARQAGKANVAAGYYERLTGLDPGNVESALHWAGQLKRAGDLDGTARVLGRLLEQADARDNAIAELSVLAREFPERRAEAEAMIGKVAPEKLPLRFLPSISPDCQPEQITVNQVYRFLRTLQKRPDIAAWHREFLERSVRSGERIEHGRPIPWGRNFDYALIRALGINFHGKRVADLGARDGYFGAWLTGEAAQVYVSDYFQGWEEEWHRKDAAEAPDSFAAWQRRWRKMAPNPERLVCETQDITKLTYPDEFFDVTVCTSVIEHMWPLDMKGMSEIVRVTKRGGFIAMSTEMSQANQWFRGTYWYGEAAFLARLIEPHPVDFIGPWNFSLDDPGNDEMRIESVAGREAGLTSSFFGLKKR